jgi:hypothetical protein
MSTCTWYKANYLQVKPYAKAQVAYTKMILTGGVGEITKTCPVPKPCPHPLTEAGQGGSSRFG